jgi:hypothetical protein
MASLEGVGLFYANLPRLAVYLCQYARIKPQNAAQGVLILNQ